MKFDNDDSYLIFLIKKQKYDVVGLGFNSRIAPFFGFFFLNFLLFINNY